MKNTTPMFPGFHLQSLRRRPISAQKKFAEEMVLLQQKSFKQVGEIFERFIPYSLLKPEQTGAMSRRRLFSKENTFWAFFSQILNSDGGCKEVIRKLQSYASIKGIRVPSSSTASYCTARKKLDKQMLAEIFTHTADQRDIMPPSGLLKNRRVIVVDGTGITMPDTNTNQAIWPQSAGQKPGCGFPSARICACFSLKTGVMLSYEVGNKKSSELPLFRQQWNIFKQGDIFLGDKGFCSYFDIAKLETKGVDSVVTLARRNPIKDVNCIKKLGEDDLLITWERPRYYKKLPFTREEWEKRPKQLRLRQIKVTVTASGFRTKSFHIVTTLLDAAQYPAHEIAELYLKRWDVELFFRDIKTTMGMDILRCQTPEMIRKEILMHFIAYNCVRRLMCEAAKAANIGARIVSFKGSVQALRNWEPHLNQVHINQQERLRLLHDLHWVITHTPIRQRFGRREPRCVKRRPKNYQRLMAPRHEMMEVPHRSQYRATRP